MNKRQRKKRYGNPPYIGHYCYYDSDMEIPFTDGNYFQGKWCFKIINGRVVKKFKPKYGDTSPLIEI